MTYLPGFVIPIFLFSMPFGAICGYIIYLVLCLTGNDVFEFQKTTESAQFHIQRATLIGMTLMLGIMFTGTLLMCVSSIVSIDNKFTYEVLQELTKQGEAYIILSTTVIIALGMWLVSLSIAFEILLAGWKLYFILKITRLGKGF